MLKSLLNKVADHETCNFIEERLQPRRFRVDIDKFSRAPILKMICVRLLLKYLGSDCLRRFSGELLSKPSWLNITTKILVIAKLEL